MPSSAPARWLSYLPPEKTSPRGEASASCPPSPRYCDTQLHALVDGEMTSRPQDAPHARSGPALVRLRRLLESVQHTIHHRVNRLDIHPHASVGIASEELG